MALGRDFYLQAGTVPIDGRQASICIDAKLHAGNGSRLDDKQKADRE